MIKIECLRLSSIRFTTFHINIYFLDRNTQSNSKWYLIGLLVLETITYSMGSTDTLTEYRYRIWTLKSLPKVGIIPDVMHSQTLISISMAPGTTFSVSDSNTLGASWSEILLPISFLKSIFDARSKSNISLNSEIPKP